ncbi:MAG: aspartyl/glutamyl-tRNA amidotransferase subunit C [Spirochaetaceae bacterium]|jgi:aspartyl-tRNA(Asn)/glutamyl-tRNA(Gln) amidotransferase subunit C|nr:aspartyl/glutamyl-tRNA amidotransferase subunit C [Spirochaetaceae bacterium]
MKIEDLKETAALAHLNLDEVELAGAFPAFEQMLGFFAAMQAADEDRAAFPAPIAGPTVEAPGSSDFSPSVYADHFRPDTGNTDDSSQNTSFGQNENLLNNAGERDGRFIVVPNVL